MDIASLLKGYNTKSLTIGVLGGHSALDVCHGAKQQGFATLAIARKGREKTYEKYYRTRTEDRGQSLPTVVRPGRTKAGTSVGCVDKTIIVKEFPDILKKDVQEKLRSMNTIFVHNRYFWVYFNDFSKVENEFNVPIFGSRSLLKLEERDGSARIETGQPYNQYHLLADAGIRTPKIFKSAKDIDRLCIVKSSEAERGYERAFFLASQPSHYEGTGGHLEKLGHISKNWREATIEEYIVGAHVNFNFFYSPLTGELELLGTDTRRQTNLDGFLRMPAHQQIAALEDVPLKMIETGHIAVTVKESLLEKAFELGEKFVKATKAKKCDPTGRGIIGPFALQGAVVAEEGKEDIVIFDVSLRIPGSPGTFATPYSRYLYGESLSVGERIGREIRMAVDQNRLAEVLT